MIELFYFNISIIKGVSRIIMLVVLNLDSFYTPAKCAFPDGKESWDGGHLTFVCYAMARVDADKEIQLEMSRKMLKLGINSLGRQSTTSDVAAFAKASGQSDPASPASPAAANQAAANQAAATQAAAAAAAPASALGEASTAAAVTLPESERVSSTEAV